MASTCSNITAQCVPHKSRRLLAEESRVSLLVSGEVRSVDIQSSNRTLSLKGGALDWGKVGGHLGTGSGITGSSCGLGISAWLSSFPDLSGVIDIVLVHCSGNTWGNNSTKDGKSGTEKEFHSGLFGIQNDLAVLCA